MAFRSIIIDKAIRINLDLNNLVIFYENDNYKINLDEISIILISDPRCNVSLRLLTELCEKGITIIFNNSSHMPVGTLQTLSNHSRSSKRLKLQISWDEKTQEYLWTEIIKRKIRSQRETLEYLNINDSLDTIDNLSKDITLGDKTNREGTVSRVYFKSLFGKTFVRFKEDVINYSLNYVYQIIRSKISQSIVSYGYNPSLGINHKSEFNTFNLADDFIEVFRPIVDYYVYQILINQEETYLTPELKHKLLNIVNERIEFSGKLYKIHTVIDIYVRSVLTFMETGDVNNIAFPMLICVI